MKGKSRKAGIGWELRAFLTRYTRVNERKHDHVRFLFLDSMTCDLLYCFGVEVAKESAMNKKIAKKSLKGKSRSYAPVSGPALISFNIDAMTTKDLARMFPRFFRRFVHSAPPLDASIIALPISFRIALVLDGGKYFSKNLFLNNAQSSVTSFDKVWYRSFAFPSRENERAKALFASSSPPILLVVAQITSKSLRCLIGSSLGNPWNRGSRLIRPDLSSKFAFSSGY
ncbi:hypothetical protein PIB30_102927 [Stylosanthes scabra]|uniref:Uncharacterized protein n=1 Tax=Stylosanthes scabra TaxID=79078 RepID=A0ABU6UXH4_9FABA|nr:hypothetical protein [Stylosanthes scabra]